MCTIADLLASWLGLTDNLPSMNDLPDGMTIEPALVAQILQINADSVAAGRERGAGIGLWDQTPPSLALGALREGTEAEIATSSHRTPQGSVPVGTFHVHPDAGGFHAPSPADVFSMIAANDMIMLVAGGGAVAPWAYLLVRTRELSGRARRILENREQLSQMLHRVIGMRINEAWNEILSEVSQITNQPTPHPDLASTVVDPTIPKQIGYERALLQTFNSLGIGFYTGPVDTRTGTCALVRRVPHARADDVADDAD